MDRGSAMSKTQPPRPEHITTARDFSAWAQAYHGVPYATTQDIKILQKKARQLFENHPGTSWQTLVAVATWMRSKKRRPARVHHIVDQFRWAYAAGAIDLAIHVDDELEEEVNEAIAVETDASWRLRLLRAAGNEAKRKVLDEWRAKHPPLPTE